MRHLLASLAISSVAVVSSAGAQTMGPDFVLDYIPFDLGPVPGVPAPYGGILFDPADSNRLLLGGSANSLAAAIYAFSVIRDQDGHIVGFGKNPEIYAAAPGVAGGIDGGLDVGPSGVLFYTSYPDNHIGQILPGSLPGAKAPDLLTPLTPLGIASSAGTLRFVPPGFPGAGRLKIASYNASRWYDAVVQPIAGGLYDIVVTQGFVQLSGGPEGIVYIAAGNPGFPLAHVLISLYQAGQVWAYLVDGNGEPIVETGRLFLSGLSGAEGAVLDPVTGDFLFSTFGGGSRIVRVSGFTTTQPCPADLNGDGSVGAPDLAILLGAWGTSASGGPDLNGNGTVDAGDLAVLLGAWGPCA